MGGRASQGPSGCGTRKGGLSKLLRRSAALQRRGSWGPPPRVSTKNTWGDRSREGVSGAGSLCLARRPEKGGRSYPWAENGALRARRMKVKGAERGARPRGGRVSLGAGGRARPARRDAGMRSLTCLRGAGNQERARPEGPVTRGRPDRTRPAAPPSCPFRSLPPTRGPLSRGRRTHQRLHLSPPLPQLLPAPSQPPPPPPHC